MYSEKFKITGWQNVVNISGEGYLLINNDFDIELHINISEIIRRFGVMLAPFSRY